MTPGPPRPWLAPALLAVAALALHLACGDRHGFFRDELYFVACGQRLDWGYVDQPPLIALVARLAWALSGHGASVLAFRLPVMVAHAASVLLGAALARRLGGGPLAMALAAAAVLAAPVQAAQGHLLTMNALELVLWSGVALLVLTAAEGRPRAWLAAGGLLGLALLTKYSAALLALALLLGLTASEGRRQLATPWPWLGAALAGLLAAPAAWWQWRHGLPFLELVHNGQAYKNARLSPGDLLGGVALDQGLLGVPLAAAGLWRLLRRPGTRSLGLALGGLLVAWPLLGAKPYYLAPLFPPLFAAGAVALEGLGRGRRLLAGAGLAAAAVGLAGAAPIAIPLLSPDATAAWMARLGLGPPRLERLAYPDLPQHQADQLGWPERVEAVLAAWQALPPEDRAQGVVFSNNYGRAAALQLLGGPRGLGPVIGGHNQYFLWGVPGEPKVVLALGGSVEDYAPDFAQVTPAGRTPVVPHGMPYESEVPLFVLRGPRRPVTELFQQSRHFE